MTPDEIATLRELETWLRNDGLEMMHGQWISSASTMYRFADALAVLLESVEMGLDAQEMQNATDGRVISPCLGHSDRE